MRRRREAGAASTSSRRTRRPCSVFGAGTSHRRRLHGLEREVTDSVGLTDASFIGRSCHCGQLAAEWADTRLCIDRDNQRAAEQTAAETYEDREQAIRRMHDDAVSDHDR